MERNHARTEMGKKYEALVFIQLLMVGRRKFTKSDFKIGRQVKTRETINQKFDDVVFCYSESNRKKIITFQVKHCSKSKTLKSTNFNQRNDDFGLEKYFISYLDLQYDIQRISGNNSVEKSQENFRDREIEFLVIFTSADIDLDDLAKNNYKYNLDEPPGIADFCIKIEENEPPKFFQLQEINENLHIKLLEAFNEFEEKKITPAEKEDQIKCFLRKFIIIIKQPNADILEKKISKVYQTDLLKNPESKFNGILRDSFEKYQKDLEEFFLMKGGLPSGWLDGETAVQLFQSHQNSILQKLPL